MGNDPILVVLVICLGAPILMAALAGLMACGRIADENVGKLVDNERK